MEDLPVQPKSLSRGMVVEQEDSSVRIHRPTSTVGAAHGQHDGVATNEAASPLERGGSSRLLAAAVAAAEELGSMSLALTQPRVEGGAAAMGAEEEASSVEPVALPPPPPAKSRTSHHNCFGLPYQDHNYGAPPPATPPQSPPPPPPLPPAPSPPPSPGQTRFNGTSPGLLVEVGSPPPLVNGGSTAGDRKEECSAPSEESVTRCICGFNQDDEYMICCDQCLVWQHVDCMGLDRSHIPETYLCERCCPRRVDRQRARSLQTRKKHQMARLLSRLESAPPEDVDATKNVECSPAFKRGSRVVRRKRQRSESSPEAPAVHKKATKEKIERKKVKLKGMLHYLEVALVKMGKVPGRDKIALLAKLPDSAHMHLLDNTNTIWQGPPLT
ncbi:hypothetical protein HPB52_021751 [Rhipicephalus sanguineus]|uniref:Zinc finger PHD-type domain-containing protein n=1 Tax=Rhipicephalus sanguineus TaxID=34632 RepID=A0A9D4QG53_RHISA|nr:hypothetical protein HPB52_021751 [Rhipicephalus sanguineus]